VGEVLENVQVLVLESECRILSSTRCFAV
jgi:hypothetical protein